MEKEALSKKTDAEVEDQPQQAEDEESGHENDDDSQGEDASEPLTKQDEENADADNQVSMQIMICLII